MPVIDRIGLYRGEIKDFAVSQTSKAKLPQLVLTLMATEWYDEENETWGGWTEYQQTITGFFVLVYLNKQGQVEKCGNYDQVMEAVGWDGETFSSLAAMDLRGKRIKFQVVEETFEGNTNFRIKQIAGENTEIGLRSLSEKALANLDAQFRVASGKPKTAAKPKAKAKAEAATVSSPPKPPKVTTPGAAEARAAFGGATPCTEEEAYQACTTTNEAMTKSVPKEVLDDYWVTRITEIAEDSDNVTPEEWGRIRTAVTEDIEIPY